jgi:hypothetical protein
LGGLKGGNTSTNPDLNRITPEFEPGSPPPPAPDVMAEIADAAGVAVDAVDAGQVQFARPDDDQRLQGPLSPVLAARLSGSSAQVDVAGQAVARPADATVDARLGGVSLP